MSIKWLNKDHEQQDLSWLSDSWVVLMETRSRILDCAAKHSLMAARPLNRSQLQSYFLPVEDQIAHADVSILKRMLEFAMPLSD